LLVQRLAQLFLIALAEVANLGGRLSTIGPGIPTTLYARVLAGCYGIPNVYAEVVGVYTNTTPVEAYRGAGRPEATFMLERLIDRLAGLDGHRVLLENSPHRDLDADPLRRTERTPFGIHFEALLPAATGRLYYGQPWDAWHWTPTS
jgi:hypothetical protein